MKHLTAKIINKTLFALLMCIIAFFVGCDGNSNLLSCFNEPFRAVVEGEVDGRFVKAEVFCDPTEHLTKEIYNRLTVTFSCPEALDGITVSLRSDGKATVRLKDTEEDMPLYDKLVEPYLVLMPSAEYASLEKTANGFKTSCEQNGERIFYYFDAEGQPKSIEGKINGRKILFSIVKVDKMGK